MKRVGVGEIFGNSIVAVSSRHRNESITQMNEGEWLLAGCGKCRWYHHYHGLFVERDSISPEWRRNLHRSLTFFVIISCRNEGCKRVSGCREVTAEVLIVGDEVQAKATLSGVRLEPANPWKWHSSTAENTWRIQKGNEKSIIQKWTIVIQINL